MSSSYQFNTERKAMATITIHSNNQEDATKIDDALIAIAETIIFDVKIQNVGNSVTLSNYSMQDFEDVFNALYDAKLRGVSVKLN